MEIYSEIIARLAKEEKNLSVKNLKVRGINIEKKVTVNGEYFQISFTINSPVKRLVTTQNEDGELITTEEESTIIFTTDIALSGVIRRTEYSFLSSYLREHHSAYQVLIPGATIDIIQEYASGEYRNPFSSTDKTTVLENPTYINHIVDIQFGKLAERQIIRIADRIADAADAMDSVLPPLP